MHYVVTNEQSETYDDQTSTFVHRLDHISPSLKRRNNNATSLLAKKTQEDMKSFSWSAVVTEMKQTFPVLLVVLCSIMIGSSGGYETILPQLGMIYGVIMKTRNSDLSLVQNIISVCMFDTVSDKKVYERLNKVGITLSYCRSIAHAQEFSRVTLATLVKAVKDGKYIRFIGDNLNFFTNVKYERLQKHAHMHHMFAIAAYVFNREYGHKSNKPEMNVRRMSHNDIALKRAEYINIRSLVIRIITPIISAYMPAFKILSMAIRNGTHEDSRHEKTTIIPLEVLPFNEMSYNDTVQIMVHMKTLAEDIHKQANKPFVNMHVGGDQLTRERFSHAKEIRLRNMFKEERLDKLYPVTIEFFHLMMNYLNKVIYKTLYTEDIDEGTLHSAKQKLSRHNVDPSRQDSYDSNKDLFVSYLTAMMLEAMQEFFGMDSITDTPSKNIPAEDDTLTKEQALYKGMCDFVDCMVLPSFSQNAPAYHEVTKQPSKVSS